MENSIKETPNYFARNILPMFLGPSVTIRISSSDNEYTVSKKLLCKESKYFRSMFEGEFKEGQQQIATLEEVDGVVSVQSVEALLLWLYTRTIKFDLCTAGDKISAAIKLARIADMCGIAGIDAYIAQYLKGIFITNPSPVFVQRGHSDTVNTYFLTSQHIISITFLPQGHPIRGVLAKAMVEQFLTTKDFQFAREAQEFPSFAADLLEEVRKTLREVKHMRNVIFKCPLSGKERSIPRLLHY